MDTLTRLDLLEWSGALVALLGALLLALNTQISRWGWLAFLASNLLMIAFAVDLQRSGMTLMHSGFLLTSVLGIYRSFIAVKRQAMPEAVARWLAEQNLAPVPAALAEQLMSSAHKAIGASPPPASARAAGAAKSPQETFHAVV